MRIGIVTHKVVIGDGQGRVNYEVAVEALRRGHRLTIIATEVAEELGGNDMVDFEACIPAGLPTQLLKDTSFRRRAAKALRRCRSTLDILMINGAITDVASDVNAAHFVHGSWINSPSHVWRTEGGAYGAYQYFYTWINARLEKAAFGRSRRIVAVSALVRDELLSIGVDDNQIVVIANGVDPDEFAPGEVDRTSLGLPGDSVIALFAGDIRQSRKNLDGVLRALAEIDDLELAVAGDTTGSPYPAMAKRIGVADRVHFLGFRKDLPELCRACDFFVLPSRYETFGLVVLEAMASGKPVVTAGTVGASALVGKGGFVVQDPEDIQALTDCMRRLAQSAGLRASMGAEARQIAQLQSFQKMAVRYVDLFEHLADSPS